MGVEGRPIKIHKTQPLFVTLDHQTMQHSFVNSPACPVHLLRRDLLHQFRAMIQCAPSGMLANQGDPRSTAPTNSIRCGRAHLRHQAQPWLTSTAVFNIDSLHPSSGLTLYREWQLFIQIMGLHIPPKDLPHCTLNYDQSQNLNYQD